MIKAPRFDKKSGKDQNRFEAVYIGITLEFLVAEEGLEPPTRGL